MYSVEGRENKKAEKNEKQRSEEKKIGTVFGLYACPKVKYCTFLHEIFLKISLQSKKAHCWQSLEKFSTVAPNDGNKG